MKNTFACTRRLVSWGLVLSSSLASLTAAPPSEPTAAKPAWSQKMQELSQAMSDLLPEIASHRPTTSPKAIAKIKNSAAKIKSLAHTINLTDGKPSPLPPDDDPSIAFLSNLFEREIKHAYSALENGNIEYAKGSLRIITNYCVACHTRTDQGPNFPSLPLTPASAKLPPYEKAQLYAATRQFDKALKEFELVISDAKFAKTQQLDWGRAVRQAFTIAVRVKKDPKQAMDIVQRVEKLKPVPPLFREYVSAWRSTIQQWQEEKPQKFETEEALYKEALRLSTAATQIQKYPLDHAADILFLRLSLIAHELLTRFPKGVHVSDAFYLAGTAYDLLDDHLISPLPEMYYEACIRNSPQTEIAKKCYKKYQANVSFGYTGSGGTSIPEDLQKLLDNLKELSGAQGEAAETKVSPAPKKSTGE